MYSRPPPPPRLVNVQESDSEHIQSAYPSTNLYVFGSKAEVRLDDLQEDGNLVCLSLEIKH